VRQTFTPHLGKYSPDPRTQMAHYVDWPRKHCQCYLSQTN